MYIVYRTTNKVNGKVYVGCHKTSNLDDGYLGSGRQLVADVKKFGKENFIRKTIKEFEDRGPALDFETGLVTKEFVKRKDTYNLKVGGGRDFGHINSNFKGQSAKQLAASQKHVKLMLKRHTELMKDDEYVQRSIQVRLATMLERYGVKSLGGMGGKHHSDKTKSIMSAKAKIHQKGSSNSQYGTKWIYNLELRVNKKIKKEELEKYLEEGWLLGRVMK